METDAASTELHSGPAYPPLLLLHQPPRARPTTRSQTAALTASSSSHAGAARQHDQPSAAASSVGRTALTSPAAGVDGSQGASDGRPRRGIKRQAVDEPVNERAKRQRRRRVDSTRGSTAVSSHRRPQPSPWSTLPADVVRDIMSRLEMRDLARSRLVAREWLRAAGAAVPELRPTEFHPAALAELFPCVEELDLTEVARQVTPAGIAALGSLTGLSHLVVGKWGRASRAGMYSLGGLPRLRCLSLEGSERLRDIHLRVLAASTSRLTWLDLSHCSCVTDVGVAALAVLTALQGLNLKDCVMVTDAGIGALAPLAGCLLDLDLAYCYQIKGATLQTLSSLQSLNLHWCENVMDHGMQEVGELRQLTALDLSMVFNATEDGMTSLLKLTALRQLNLTDSMELTQGRFAQLATLSSLHALCLRDCFELKSESLAGMAAGLAGLRDLDICGCEQLAEDAIMALSSLRALTQLNVGSCQQAVTNRSCKALGSIVSLRHLVAEDCTRLSSRGIAALTGLTNLESLNVAYCGAITDSAMRSLSQLTALTRLNFGRCNKLTGRAFSALHRLPRLTSLHLMWCSLNHKAFVKLASMTALVDLNISGCVSVRDGDLALFGQRLLRLRSFSCSYCERVTSGGVIALSRLPSLRHVSVVGCTGVRALAGPDFPDNPCLKVFTRVQLGDDD